MAKYGFNIILLVGIGRAQTVYHGVAIVRLVQHYAYMGWYYKRVMKQFGTK
jgi:hypothetical protein